MNAGKAIGAVLAIIAVIGLSVLRFQAKQARYERIEQELAQRDQNFLAGAHSLVSQAKDQNAAKYLNAAVDEFHDEAFDQESNSDLLYRNALFELMSAKAAKAGREDVSRALNELKLKSGFNDETCFQLRQKT